MSRDVDSYPLCRACDSTVCLSVCLSVSLSFQVVPFVSHLICLGQSVHISNGQIRPECCDGNMICSSHDAVTVLSYFIFLILMDILVAVKMRRVASWTYCSFCSWLFFSMCFHWWQYTMSHKVFIFNLPSMALNSSRDRLLLFLILNPISSHRDMWEFYHLQSRSCGGLLSVVHICLLVTDNHLIWWIRTLVKRFFFML